MSHQVHALRVVPIFAAVLWAGISSSATSAQVSRPDTTRPAAPTSSGNWWDTPVPGSNSPQQQPPLFRHDNGGYGFSGDYPMAPMNDWVTATAMAARARAMLLHAESDLNLTIRHVQQRFEHSDEFAKAAMAEKQAYNDYIAARQKSLASVANDPKYRAISLLRDELADKIARRRNSHADESNIDNWLAARGFERSKLTGEQMRSLKAIFDSEQEKAAPGDTTKDEILAMATLKMQYASDARAIEVAALGADDNLKASRDKMVEASHRVSDLKTQFEFSIRDNPEVLMARRNLEMARIGVVEAQALANSASISSSYALNYSYYLHRNDNSGMYGANGAYGSYSSPYWGR